jgi:Ca-activated chloride channel family protein
MKASRVAALAVQLCCAALMSGPVLAANASSVWSSLWRTPEQQGQALLDAGQPAQAAQRFRDPRRRAYADLQAGGYAGAAKLLAPFTDAQSEYNRGNALAKSGQLQAALTAYDSALKQAPADKDIRRNRDLVERALRQQPQKQQQQSSPQSSSGHGQQGRQGQQGKPPGTSQGQRPQSSATGKQGSSGPQQQAGGASPQSRPGGPQSAGDDRSSPNDTQPGANRPDDSGQAQRDATEAAKLARAQQQRGGAANTTPGRASGQNGKASGSDSLLTGGAQTPKPKPETERQMALDQWLRQIPDNPAGLLQRKFLIEHMIRQQGGNSPEGTQ